ncbi:rhodanese-like domain-containing protein [Tumebacillus sp. ITR2]|uniref:Rhodanese-like domain-containing protein n=1 Tax=Tumebacillus amylolyticus TaxID=2801339 RepID=A0ABS1J5M7_9BACL|nr:rhodanese-like domain-containing protein [Tumebacillus amylolyticus]MBL0385591.1 rhodanese-like domain-containing protein [Tumebacillus amylolyticus]
MKSKENDIPQVSPEEVLNRLSGMNAPTIVDVRENEEVAHGTIRDALHIPLADLSMWIEDLREHEEIVIVCKTGRRSTVACEILMEKGLHQVRNMTGGLVNWKGELSI